jgi:photosystem II stability/assembly factor-like uncharacterized protein
MKKIYIIISMLIFISINSQATGWLIQSSPTTQNLHGVAFSDANTWVAVGDAGTILRSSNGGNNWSIISSTLVDALRSVSFRGNLGLIVGLTGRVARTTNGGINWVEETRPTTKNLYSVSIGNLMSVITGEEGTILVSLDDGLTWNPHSAGTASIIFGVCVNGINAVGVGGQGAIVMSDNTGNAWGLTVLGGQLTFFYGTSFFNGSTGWAVGSSSTTGNVIIKSTASGFVWTGQTAPTTEQLFGVSFASADTGTAVGGNGTIIHTINGGGTWVSQSSGTFQILNSVSFETSTYGIAVGNLGTILKTTDGGSITGVQNISYAVPSNYSLEQNYPNPFNPSTNIRYQISNNKFVNLKIFNASGREIETLVNENQSPGTYEIRFNGSNYSSGIYFYRLTTDGFNETKKMILLK